MTKISCVIIVFNEEQNIGRCLQAISWCDEIVIVDSGSEDRTLKICEEFNCKIYHKNFCGYGEQKRFAVSLAENDWVFNIDADEVVAEELKNEILAELSKENISSVFFKSCLSLENVFIYCI